MPPQTRRPIEPTDLPYCPHPLAVRAVWMIVTHDPHLSYREIMEKAPLGSTSTVEYCIRYLEWLGYIEKAPGRCRALRVIVPFGPPDKEMFDGEEDEGRQAAL